MDIGDINQEIVGYLHVATNAIPSCQIGGARFLVSTVMGSFSDTYQNKVPEFSKEVGT